MYRKPDECITKTLYDALIWECTRQTSCGTCPLEVSRGKCPVYSCETDSEKVKAVLLAAGWEETT